MSAPIRPVAAALLGAFLIACGSGEKSRPAQRVILITCDTLRADRLGFGGYSRPVSPNLDALAAESVVYDNAWSAAPLTGPALSSLLTGRFPDEIGAGPTNREVMPEEVLSIAEVARDAGLATAAFVSNGVLRRPPPSEGQVGVQQGFNVFDDEMNAKELNRNLLERTADACTDAVLKWLGERDATDPFFLWVHYQDPHGPYTPPDSSLKLFERPQLAGPVLARSADNGGNGWIPKYQYIEGFETPRPYEDRYDAEIHFFDQHVGRLIDELRTRGMLDDALLVFTADHGEALGEHDYWFCHGQTVYRDLVRVPLFVRYPKGSARAKTPRREPSLVGHVDLWPTIVEALALEAPANRGVSLFDAPPEEGRVMPQFLGPIRNPNRHLAVTDGRWRVILVKAASAELFDLRDDPGELRNLAEKHPDVLADLHQRYTQFMLEDQRPWSKAVRPNLDPATRRELQNLGYTDGDDH